MENTKPLYHYTSQRGLLGILESKKLWMTNILYLNDSSEFIYTWELVKPELSKRKKLFEVLRTIGKEEYSNIDEKKYHTCNIIVDIIDQHLYKTGIHYYVFSLSTKKDDLNQWRGYCPKEGGFCVEFDNKKLSSIINKIEKSEIRKCIYDPVEKKDLLESLLNRIVDVPLESNKDISEVSTNFILEVINISSHIKDESFKDEGEYRLIYFGGPNETKFHEGRSMIIPYIEFSPVDDSDLLPISKIIVGPTPHPELSKLSIKTLLKSKKYNIEVEQSDIPYRSW